MYLLSHERSEDLMLAISCGSYSLFLVSSIAIVTVISVARILSGSMTYSNSIWMSISQRECNPRSENTAVTIAKARMTLITMRILIIR